MNRLGRLVVELGDVVLVTQVGAWRERRVTVLHLAQIEVQVYLDALALMARVIGSLP